MKKRLARVTLMATALFTVATLAAGERAAGPVVQALAVGMAAPEVLAAADPAARAPRSDNWAGEGSAIAVLDREAEPVRVIAGGSEVTARFDRESGDRLVLRMALASVAFGGAEIETSVRLIDGQSHKIVLGSGGGDSFTFTRRGGRIDIVAYDAPDTTEIASLAPQPAQR